MIAGASEGVGACLADQLAERGVNLILIARNGPLLAEVGQRARDGHGVEVRTLVLDLTEDPMVGQRIAAATTGLEVGLLIYNAGAVNRTVTFLEESFDFWLSQVRLNCVGPLSLVYEFAPAMRDRGRGGIVIVSSLGCFAGAPYIAVYSAEKMFQVNFAEGLWAELRAHGVDVCCAVLGATDTPANRRRGLKDDPEHVMPAEDVAGEIIAYVDKGPLHVVGEKNRAMTGSWEADRRRAMDVVGEAMQADAQRLA